MPMRQKTNRDPHPVILVLLYHHFIIIDFTTLFFFLFSLFLFSLFPFSTSFIFKSGASTSAQSVQLNLREYPKYSTTEGVVECTTADDTTVVVAMKEENQAACKLALARGKKALLRVGGGETSNDVATSVWAYKDNDNNTTTFAKYMMLHGVGKLYSFQYLSLFIM